MCQKKKDVSKQQSKLIFQKIAKQKAIYEQNNMSFTQQQASGLLRSESLIGMGIVRPSMKR